MSDPIFNQGFVYCFICHRRHSPEDPLRLTSCAHILCSAHSSNSSECPVCSTRHISIMELTDRRTLPSDVLSYFLPMPELAETLYNASQFQQQALLNQIQYYQDHVVKLREKVARQQQLLYKAKKELDGVTDLKRQVSSLENQLQERSAPMRTSSKFFDTKRRSSSVSTKDISGYNTPAPPMTVDLTMDEVIPQEDTFLSKLKKSSSSLRGSTLQNHGQYVATAPIEPLQQTNKNKEHPRISSTARKQSSNSWERSFPSSQNSIGDKSQNLAAESTHMNMQRFAYSPVNIGKVTTDSLPANTSSSPIHTKLLRGSSNIAGKQVLTANNRNQNRFPQSLSKLRIIKRNNTTNNDTTTRPRSISNNKQGIVAHMRSSTTTSDTNNHDKRGAPSNHKYSSSQGYRRY